MVWEQNSRAGGLGPNRSEVKSAAIRHLKMLAAAFSAHALLRWTANRCLVPGNRSTPRSVPLLSLESIENYWLTWRNPIISHHNTFATFATNPRIGSPTKEGGIRVSLRRRRCKCGECGRKTSKPTHVYEYGDDDRIRIVCPDCMAQYPDGRCADGGPARTRPEAINGRKPQTSSSSTVPPLEGAAALVRHHLHTHRRWRANSL
jgi:hypothetical protein